MDLRKGKIIANYYKETVKLLVGDYPILDTGTDYDVAEELTSRIQKMKPRHKRKIRKLFTTYMFDWEKGE